MKNTYILISFFIFSLISCSKDDAPQPQLQNNDITVSVDEYPSSGTLISNLTTSLTGDVTFSIASQTDQDAIILNGASIFVGDWLAYDYEASETINGIIVATNGTESETIDVTININNIDDIWAFLNGDSKTAYDNANDGEWVKVTQSEYNNVANYLTDVNRAGQNESIFNSNVEISIGGADFTVSINNAPTLSSGEYLYAFKYYCAQNGTTNSNVKLSETSYQDNFSVIGSNLPMHDSGYNYFVLKGNNTPTTNTAYLGVYESNTIGYRSIPGETYFYRSGDVTNITNNGLANRRYLYQCLSTTLKQWD
ncbi:hypothetical protein [uncultured Lacinutrix sp.]|uniref:hypothetical protein n=1 Tax=uncultured Lacinutrix sp. TaxID=574032 RepID=UPI00260DB418|nr:hypothetical protein [uncultured Lacinutrix sp.]